MSFLAVLQDNAQPKSVKFHMLVQKSVISKRACSFNLKYNNDIEPGRHLHATWK